MTSRLIAVAALCCGIIACGTGVHPRTQKPHIPCAMKSHGAQNVALNVDFQGVWTNPNQHSKVPAGAATRAENVVNPRPGVASTVPGQENLTAYSGSDERFSSGINYQGCIVEHTQDAFDGGAEDAYLYVRDPSTDTLTPQPNVGDPAYAYYPPEDVTRIPFAIAGDKLYLATSAGVLVKDGVNAAPAAVGLPAPFAPYYSIPGSGSAFEINPGESVAYRSEIRRKDSQGVEIVSAPSGRTEVVNTASGTKAHGTVTLSGSANNVTLTFNGIVIGPVAAGANDTATTLDLATAFNLTPAAVDIATVFASGTVLTITAKSNGTYANAFTLVATSTSGSAVVSGATLSGGTGGETQIITKNYLPTGLVAGDIFRLYRTATAASGVPAGDIMYLVHEALLTGTEVTNRYHEWTDDTPDALRGEPLYTNSTGEGILKQNERPPYAKVMEAFDDSLLLGNVRGPQRLTIRMLGLPSNGDVLTIAGDTFTASSTTEAPLTGTFLIYSTSPTVSKQIEDTAKSLILAINRKTSNTAVFAYYASSENDPPGIIAIEARDVTTTAFTAEASANGEVYEPPLDAAKESLATTERNGVWVSKRGQHYAFPPQRGASATYRFRVGVKGNDILAMAHLRDAVIVFVQGEGVFKAKRVGFEGWRVDQISSTCNLLAPNSVAVLDNQVIALTTRGIVVVDEGGVEEIDLQIKDSTLAMRNLDADLLKQVTFGVADEQRLRYILYHPLTDASTTADHAWVYNAEQGTWTERTDPASGGLMGEDGLLYLGDASSNHLTRERTGTASQIYKRPDNSAIPVRIDWTVMDEGDPGAMKQFQELRLLTKDAITGNVTFACTNDLGGQESTTASTVDNTTGEPYVRAWVPDGCQRTSRLNVSVQRSVLSQAFEVVGMKAMVAGAYNGGMAR